MVKIKKPFTASLEDGSKGDSVDMIEDKLNESQEAESIQVEGMELGEWLRIARDAYDDSDRYMESSLRVQWERNERAFQNRFPTGSKYLSDAYKQRTKLYRPKTRAMIRTGEAMLATSYFSNEDVIAVSPMDETSPDQVASAEILKELLQYRITTPNPRIALPWFMTAVGAYQDAQKYGVVFSKQWWEYRDRVETRTRMVPVMDPLTGQPYMDPTTGEPFVDPETGQPPMQEEEYEHRVIIRDRPRIDILPPENVRVDRSADWRDPINTSPFVIIEHAMYVHEVERRMEEPNFKTGIPQFFKLDRTLMKASTRGQDWDSTRSVREGNREDSKESETSIDEFSLIWVNENIVEWKGRDGGFVTSRTEHMLSEPVPLEEVYPHINQGDRPIVMGYSLIETNKIYPSGKPQLTEGLQMEANEIVNLRLDNVKLALNKRWLVKRGRQVDLKSIVRNSPGSITLVTDVNDDVKPFEIRDVTSSSFQEQDRINADFDDVAGNFSTGSVQTNRKMNETVGGMELLAGAANNVSELDLRVFTETWTEPVLRQVVRMEQVYETDKVILAIAGKRAKLFDRYGIDTITDELLQHELTVKLNVGIGATDPMQRLQKFQLAAKTIGDIFGESVLKNINEKEVVKEVFGALGYRDGSRFYDFDGENPVVMQLQEQLQELQKKIETKEIDNQTKVQVAQIMAESRLQGTREENQSKERQEQLRQTSAAQPQQQPDYKPAEMQQKAKEHQSELMLKKQLHDDEMALKRYESDQEISLKRADAAEKANIERERIASIERTMLKQADINARAQERAAKEKTKADADDKSEEKSDDKSEAQESHEPTVVNVIVESPSGDKTMTVNYDKAGKITGADSKAAPKKVAPRKATPQKGDK